MSRFAFGALALTGLLFVGGPATAQDVSPAASKALQGTWISTLKVNDQVSLRLGLRVEKDKAVVDSFDQGVKDIPVSSLTLENGKVKFDSQQIMAHFEGQLDEKAGEIAGTWEQPGGSFPLTFKRGKEAELKVGAAAPKELEGRWTGTLKVNDEVSFRLALRVEKPKTGDGWTAVIDSLDQGANGIPVTAIELKGDELTFENKGIAAKFVGKVDQKKGEITGDWTQPGGTWPLTLTKTK
jgi:hypothetical protein